MPGPTPLTAPNLVSSQNPSNPELQPPAPPAVSPTGSPIIPPGAVPYLVALITAAEFAAETLPTVCSSPWCALAAKGAHFVVVIGTLFGIASPGLRRSAAA